MNKTIILLIYKDSRMFVDTILNFKNNCFTCDKTDCNDCNLFKDLKAGSPSLCDLEK
jgi:hypothetical protein